MAVNITQDNVEQEINKADKPVVLDVYATWCGPCQQMAPIFEELEKELGSQYKFAKLNVDDARELSISYQVSSVPTFVFIKEGKVVGREVGFMDKDSMKEKITSHLG